MAAPSPRASLGRRTVCGRRSSVCRRFRSVTKLRLESYWGAFLLLQQRSKHSEEMVITPKASISPFDPPSSSAGRALTAQVARPHVARRAVAATLPPGPVRLLAQGPAHGARAVQDRCTYYSILPLVVSTPSGIPRDTRRYTEGYSSNSFHERPAHLSRAHRRKPVLSNVLCSVPRFTSGFALGGSQC